MSAVSFTEGLFSEYAVTVTLPSPDIFRIPVVSWISARAPSEEETESIFHLTSPAASAGVTFAVSCRSFPASPEISWISIVSAPVYISSDTVRVTESFRVVPQALTVTVISVVPGALAVTTPF